MLDQEAKVQEKSSSSSMPTLTEKPDEDVPTEVALAILYTMARRLEAKALAQVLTGHTPKGEKVTYIKLIGVTVDPEKGLVLAVPTEGTKE
jgi:hypothetical protein